MGANLLLGYLECYARRLITDDTFWYRVDSPREQVDSILQHVGSAVISGDTAADVISPWRFPATNIVYATVDPEQMDALGFVVADDRNTATTLLRPLPDRRLLDESDQVDQMLVVPHLHLAADLMPLSADRVEHAQRIVES